MRLSGERRAAIRERVEAATPGPWEWRPTGKSGEDNSPEDFQCYWLGRGDVRILAADDGRRADAAFIAAARTDVPLLLEALEEAEREVERLRALIEPTRL